MFRGNGSGYLCEAHLLCAAHPALRINVSVVHNYDSVRKTFRLRRIQGAEQDSRPVLIDEISQQCLYLRHEIGVNVAGRLI